MFINQGDLVTVRDGVRTFGGRFGRVTKIRLCSETGNALVFVDLESESGASDLALLGALDLVRWRDTPAKTEQANTRMDRQQTRREWREFHKENQL